MLARGFSSKTDCCITAEILKGTPMTSPIYAIGDIHGQLDELQRILSWIEADGGPDAQIVFLGDYVDRGPASAGVIDLLLHAQAAQRPWVTLQGNHDRYFSRFLSHKSVRDSCSASGLHWLNPRLGGDKTLASYGIHADEHADMTMAHHAALQSVPQAHRDFLSDLPCLHVTPDLAFVHAGIVTGIPLDQQSPDDLIWIREPFLSDQTDHGRLIVHGHTALECPKHYGNRINLDAGAGYGRPLHAAVFEGRKCWTVGPNGHRAPLIPT
jgi:serine/threonine protein phosphatase 1